jgi:putative ABC transport system permease protein
MLRHNLLLIYRNFWRFRSVFFINLAGLSAGLACTLLIWLWVNDELKVDKFHEKDDLLFQVMVHEQADAGLKTTSQTQHFTAAALADEMPEIEYAVTTTPSSFFPGFMVSYNGRYAKGTGKYAGSDFFNIFSYDLIQGQRNLVLADKHAVVLSESMAMKLFNSTSDIIGKTLEYSIFDIKKQVVVSGVFKDVPGTASEHFDFVLPFDAFLEITGIGAAPVNWNFPAPFHAYVTLKPGANATALNFKLREFISRKSSTSPFTLFLVPYSDNYLYGKYENGVRAGGRIGYVRLFSVIAVFILVIACINFTNLFTAKASARIRDAGIRKAVGASRKSLMVQYLAESVLMSVISLFIAILMADLLLPAFNSITGKTLHIEFSMETIVAMTMITLSTGMMAGLYPALYLSRCSAAAGLKGKVTSTTHEVWIRKGLVMFQFAVSVILIVSVMVVYGQIEFIQSRSLGYDKDNLLYFEVDGKAAESAEAFLTEVKNIPGVVSASSMLGSLTGEGNGLPGSIVRNGRQVVIHSAAVNYGMLETLGVELKAGRFFWRTLDNGADTVKWILNEAAVEALELKDPVGQTVEGREIIGVVRNFHFQSLHESVKPFSFRLEPHFALNIWVRIDPQKQETIIRKLRACYQKFNPGLPFDYTFLDQAYDAQYKAEKKVAALSKYFATLAILISCLGLLGLAAFNAERRRKEIGVRKVMGATELGIVALLSADLTRLVIAAIAVALPLAYLITRSWLDSFAYRITLQWWYFTGAGIIALAIAALTVMAQAVRAATADPVRWLRDE